MRWKRPILRVRPGTLLDKRLHLESKRHPVRQPRAETGQPPALRLEPRRNHLLPSGRDQRPRHGHGRRPSVHDLRARPRDRPLPATRRSASRPTLGAAARLPCLRAGLGGQRRRLRRRVRTWSRARRRSVAYPDAEDRVLYCDAPRLDPRDRGQPDQPRPRSVRRDPRRPTAGRTRYVGLPANGMTQVGAFGSPLLGADSALGDLRLRRRDHLRPLLRRRLDEHPAAPRRRQPGRRAWPAA